MNAPQSILISGASGFLGTHLTTQLAERWPAAQLHSIGLNEPTHKKVSHHACNLTHSATVKAILAAVRPQQIYHLAGSARISKEVSFPEYFQSNFLTTVSLAQAIESLALQTSIFLASSVHVYGNQPDTVDETSAVAPLSPYAHSKYLAEQAFADLAARLPAVHVVIGRLYSCIGPGQPLGFVTSDLAQRLARLEPGQPLRTGPLVGFRRFLDVRDAVVLFATLLDSPQLKSGEIVNIASAEEATIREIVDRLIRISGKTVVVESEETSAKPTFTGLRVNVDKLARVVPQIAFRSLEESLTDIWQAAVNNLAVPCG